MEPKHLQRLRAEYARLLEHKLIHVLEIPDDFQYMDPELVELLESAVGDYLEGSELRWFALGDEPHLAPGRHGLGIGLIGND